MNHQNIPIVDVPDETGWRITGDYSEQDWYGDVRINGEVLPLKPSQKVYNHSPTGFAWGYGGSGPTQLALAILLKAGVPKDKVHALTIPFRNEFITRLPHAAPFSIVVDVPGWVKEHLK